MCLPKVIGFSSQVLYNAVLWYFGKYQLSPLIGSVWVLCQFLISDRLVMREKTVHKSQTSPSYNYSDQSVIKTKPSSSCLQSRHWWSWVTWRSWWLEWSATSSSWSWFWPTLTCRQPPTSTSSISPSPTYSCVSVQSLEIWIFGKKFSVVQFLFLSLRCPRLWVGGCWERLSANCSPQARWGRVSVTVILDLPLLVHLRLHVHLHPHSHRSRQVSEAFLRETSNLFEFSEIKD